MEIKYFDTIIIGSGAAGFNAADWLYDYGRRSIAIITEGRGKGTSRNTGSDKQTYYKLSLSGGDDDSIRAMAEDIYGSGDTDGRLSYAEAAGSVESFMKLVLLGVPFPSDHYGQFVGYRTDHDPRTRATSAGPLTSRYMTEALERRVMSRGIAILDGYTAVKLVVEGKTVRGVITLHGFEPVYIRCSNIIWCTGGPAGIYKDTVYPESQRGMSGLLLWNGARGCNLQHWQYGIASVKFRWNLSGTYQQVLPRYVSVDEDGCEHEFLSEDGDNLDREFLKGYQWPFDSRKIRGSSHIDMLVYEETIVKGRRVFLDYTRNPSDLSPDFSSLGDEAYDYLRRSGALCGTPLERLRIMNPLAIELYRQHGIDLSKEMLEIRISAQSHNGGILVDSSWKSDFDNLYVAGEAAGTFGAYRPGGTALNSGQVGSMRAARHIASERKEIKDIGGLTETERDAVSGFALPSYDEKKASVSDISAEFRTRMSHVAGVIRDIPGMVRLKEDLEAVINEYEDNVSPDRASLPETYFTVYDQLVTSLAVVSAMIESGKLYGSSGGSIVNGSSDGTVRRGSRLITGKKGGAFVSYPEEAEPVPSVGTWFENDWASYREEMSRISGNIAD